VPRQYHAKQPGTGHPFHVSSIAFVLQVARVHMKTEAGGGPAIAEP